jgi:hypothetical protein
VLVGEAGEVGEVPQDAVVLREVAKGGLSRSQPVDEELVVAKEGRRRRARAGTPVVDFRRGWSTCSAATRGSQGDS